VKPKTLTRLLAFGGLTGMIALHRIPEKYFPFHSTAVPTVIVVGLLVAAHRNPLRMLYKDASNMLAKLWDRKVKIAVDTTNRDAKVLT